MSRSRVVSTFLFAFVSTVAFSAVAGAAELTPREIYKRYGKAVVLIFATDGSAQGSAGTGSIITKDGQVITNAHVVSKDGQPFKKIFIYLKPDKLVGSMKDDLKLRYKATILDLEPNLDLALLKMDEAPADLATISFVDPDSVEVGEPVVAIGHPETGGLWTLTSGSISSVVKDFQGIEGKDVFQTEASVNRGNSGGPLLNAFGQMVGINTCISRRAADGLAITDINFSLKSSVPVEWMKRRRLLTLAYVKPDEAGGSVGAVAVADTKPDAKSAVPTPPATDSKTQVGDGKTKIAVVEPPKGEEVADDAQFNSAASASSNVSATVDMKGSKKGKPAAQQSPPKVEAKHLTKARPYKLDAFVSDRIKEIKALEQIMDESEAEIRRKLGNKSKRPDTSGNGLW